MKRFLALAALLSVCALNGLADDLARLEGKWTVKKTGPDGTSYTQVIEIKKDKFKFRILKGTDDLTLYAEGTVKTETSGPFNVIKFTDIRAGGTESDLQSVSDDRASVYMLGEDTWTVASNLDKERDQKPSLDVYAKSKK